MALANTLARLLGVGAVMAAVAAPASMARPAHAQSAHGGLTPLSVPATLRVPAGNTAYLVGHATGVQIYTCALKGVGFGWSPATPAALLLTNDGMVIHHYVTIGPTWQAPDGSYVRGTPIASVLSPDQRGRSVPWLLLRVVGGGKGYTGGTTLSATTYVQRLDTRGGQAPANGCDAATVGAGAAMPYAADYYFYRATR
jgi:hypothetical protein